jgi:aldehyde:ferredoxin oxidoreductase
MGAKKIKAIVVKGRKPVKPKDEARFSALVKKLQRQLNQEPLVKLLREFGSPYLFMLINRRIGMGRAYNGLSVKFPQNEDISPWILKEKYFQRNGGCFSCPVACQHEYRVGEITNEGPEYTTFSSFGPVLGIRRIETVLRINDLVNRYGLDASSTANLIAWAIELFKEGLIDEEVTHGLKLDWGDEEAVIELIHQIAHRRAFGDLLADGAKEAVKRLGDETSKYLLWTKYLPQSDPVDLRYFPAYALGNSVASRGLDHLRSRPTWEAYGLSEETMKSIYGGYVSADPRSYEGKGRVIWWRETYLSLFDALGLCKQIALACQPGVFDLEFFSELLRYTTGLDLTPEEIFSVGDRIITLERMFLSREGIGRKDDFPPQRYFEPLAWQDGLKPAEKNLKLDKVSFGQMLDEYYQLRGWDSEGQPLVETKHRLGLGQ